METQGLRIKDEVAPASTEAAKSFGSAQRLFRKKLSSLLGRPGHWMNVRDPYWDNGKENGSYYSGFRVQGSSTLPLA